MEQPNGRERLDLLRGFHIGKVIDDRDPKKLFRLKCQIPGVFEPIIDDEGAVITSNIPWIHPYDFVSKMGINYPTKLNPVPRIGTLIAVHFPDPDNIDFSLYEPIDNIPKNTLPSLQDEYLDIYGFVDHNKNYFLINRKTKYIHMVSNTGTYLKFEPNGDIILNGVNNETITIAEDATITIGKNLTHTVVETSTTKTKVLDSTVEDSTTYKTKSLDATVETSAKVVTQSMDVTNSTSTSVNSPTINIKGGIVTIDSNVTCNGLLVATQYFSGSLLDADKKTARVVTKGIVVG